MKKIIIALIVLVIAAILTYYLVFNNKTVQTVSNTPQVATTTQTSNTPVVSNPSEVKIDIKNFSFIPSTINVKVGTKITWTNSDNVPHQVKGDNLATLSAPVMNNGETYSFVFNDVGDFNYHCAIHPTMKGNIIVTK